MGAVELAALAGLAELPAELFVWQILPVVELDVLMIAKAGLAAGLEAALAGGLAPLSAVTLAVAQETVFWILVLVGLAGEPGWACIRSSQGTDAPSEAQGADGSAC